MVGLMSFSETSPELGTLASTPMPLVITVILNTNRREDTLETLASLERSTYERHHVIVLDNASQDGSVEAIRQKHPDVQIIELTQNRGYAGNNNIGIEAAIKQGADWILVLNEDTSIDPACLLELVQVGQSDTQVGILGPMVYHYDEPQVIQSAGGLLAAGWDSKHLGHNELDQGQYSRSHQVDYISGCAILVRRDVITDLGMLDERFFYYFEETEWCLRASRASWKVIHVPHARIWHKGVQRHYKPGANVTYYKTRNKFLMLSKHHAPVKEWVFAWLSTLRTLLSWSIRPKWRDMRDHRNAILQGMLDFLQHRWGIRSVKTVENE
jgi:GT2 family glycosyltransferase